MLTESAILTDGGDIGIAVSDFGDSLTLVVWNERQVELLVEDRLPERARGMEICELEPNGWLVLLDESEPRANDSIVIQIAPGDMTVTRGAAAKRRYKAMRQQVIWQNLACGQRSLTPLTERAYQ